MKSRASWPRTVAGVVGLAWAVHASAQTSDTTSPPLAAAPLPDVNVTGTAIRRLDAETALPITVLRRVDIERAGARSTAELLQSLPMVQGFTPQTAVVGNDTRGFTGVSLHGLGEAYTLVLLNGQRLAPFGGQLSSGALSGVDLNTIPLAAIERIEVLSDGASALYGADALGGVVNIITRRDGDANEATLGTTLPRSGAREWRLSALKSVGELASTGQNLSLSLAASHRTALTASQRDFARPALFAFEHDGQRYRFVDPQYAAIPANGYDSTVGGNPYLQTNGVCPSGHADYYGACIYDYASQVDLVPEQSQRSLMASYTRLIGQDGKLQAELLWSHSSVVSHLAPASTTLIIPASSPFYSAYLAGLGVSDDPGYADYRFGDLGRRGFTDDSDLIDLALRLEGRTQGWRWQAAAKHSVSDARSSIAQALGSNAAQRLVDDGLINPFLPLGQQSAQGLAALQRNTFNGEWLRGRSTLQELQWQANRELMDLPGGALNWAIGLNHRRESLDFKPSRFAQGLLSDPAAGTLATSSADADLRLGDAFPILPSRAQRQVWGTFTELLAPVSPTVELGGSARWDHDSLSGSATTAKVQARWHPTPQWLWRASLGSGFKAPSLNQLTSPAQSYGSTALPYDCSSELQALAQSLGATPCTTGSSQSYAQVLSGHAGLKPERSVQASLGFKVEPAKPWTLGADLWSVHIRDRIGTVPEAVAFGQPQAFPGTWTTVDGLGGTELAFRPSPLNLGSLISTGVDLEASARQSTAWGLLTSRVLATTILREDAHNYPGGPKVSRLGNAESDAPTLRWRAQWQASLSRGAWTHTLTAHHQSGYRDTPAQVELLDNTGQPTGQADTIRLKVKSQTTWDWQTSWQVREGWRLSLGVVNLLDAKPPLSLALAGQTKGQMLGYDERYFDARGRMVVAEARLGF